jgi:glucokinase
VQLLKKKSGLLGEYRDTSQSPLNQQLAKAAQALCAEAPSGAVLAVAGRVKNAQVELPNRGETLKLQEIERMWQCPVMMINDLVAAALGVLAGMPKILL